jgi:ribosomal protein S18 acetylase RimI-like enzyme
MSSARTIRPFDLDDLPALQRIREAAFAPVFQSFRDIVGQAIAAHAFASADAEQAKLLADICVAGSAHQVLIVTLGSEVVGFVSFTINAENTIGEIGLNAVHPDHAGRGIGTWMYQQVTARMKERGVALVTVGTGNNASHAAARRAYEKVGFGQGISSVYLYKLL